MSTCSTCRSRYILWTTANTLAGAEFPNTSPKSALVAEDMAREHAFYNAGLDLHDSFSSDGVMLVPGGSGDEVKLQAASESTHPYITFEVSNAGRAAKELRHRGLNVQSNGQRIGH